MQLDARAAGWSIRLLAGLRGEDPVELEHEGEDPRRLPGFDGCPGGARDDLLERDDLACGIQRLGNGESSGAARMRRILELDVHADAGDGLPKLGERRLRCPREIVALGHAVQEVADPWCVEHVARELENEETNSRRRRAGFRPADGVHAALSSSPLFVEDVGELSAPGRGELTEDEHECMSKLVLELEERCNLHEVVIGRDQPALFVPPEATFRQLACVGSGRPARFLAPPVLDGRHPTATIREQAL